MKHLAKKILPSRAWQSLRKSWRRSRLRTIWGTSWLVRSWQALSGSQATVRGFLFAMNARPTALSSAPFSDTANTPNPLEQYFDAHTEGHGIWKWRHYFSVYHRHLQKFVGRDAHILEIGVYSGGSLKMLQDYFGPQSHIYGVDIAPSCKAYETENVKIFIGDQADRSFWNQVKSAAPTLDVIIDDGGHLPHQQIATLEEMLPHLRPGGIFICEDVHEPFNGFAQYTNGIMQSLNEFSWKVGAQDGSSDLSVSPTAFQSSISGVHVYPFMVVIEKADSPVTEFSAPRHGTEWQPRTFWAAQTDAAPQSSRA